MTPLWQLENLTRDLTHSQCTRNTCKGWLWSCHKCLPGKGMRQHEARSCLIWGRDMSREYILCTILGAHSLQVTLPENGQRHLLTFLKVTLCNRSGCLCTADMCLLYSAGYISRGVFRNVTGCRKRLRSTMPKPMPNLGPKSRRLCYFFGVELRALFSCLHGRGVDCYWYIYAAPTTSDQNGKYGTQLTIGLMILRQEDQVSLSRKYS